MRKEKYTAISIDKGRYAVTVAFPDGGVHEMEIEARNKREAIRKAKNGE